MKCYLRLLINLYCERDNSFISKNYTMKNYYTITLLILFAALSFKKMNMAKITPNLYMNKYEVTNGDWKIFEQHLVNEGENPVEYRSNDVWEHMGELFKEQYYSKTEFNKYPVAGVT